MDTICVDAGIQDNKDGHARLDKPAGQAVSSVMTELTDVSRKLSPTVEMIVLRFKALRPGP